jgi:hypothetical protein
MPVELMDAIDGANAMSRRSPRHGRLWPLPLERVDVRWRHADGPVRSGPPGPDVPMSVGLRPSKGPFDRPDVLKTDFPVAS